MKNKENILSLLCKVFPDYVVSLSVQKDNEFYLSKQENDEIIEKIKVIMNESEIAGEILEFRILKEKTFKGLVDLEKGIRTMSFLLNVSVELTLGTEEDKKMTIKTIKGGDSNEVGRG